MKPLLLFFLLAALSSAASAPPASFPNESLDYSINWPTGLSLGEAHWKAHNAGTAVAPQWEFDFAVDAHVPGYGISDQYHSQSLGVAFCADQFGRQLQHGSRTSAEKVTIDPKAHQATRKTEKGGESHFDVPDCVRDVLSFLFFARHELSSGRVPLQQTVLLGASYQVRLKFLGQLPVKIDEKNVDTDRVACEIKGPVADLTAEVFFARDSVRTPVLVKIPLRMGVFSLELQH